MSDAPIRLRCRMNPELSIRAMRAGIKEKPLRARRPWMRFAVLIICVVLGMFGGNALARLGWMPPGEVALGFGLGFLAALVLWQVTWSRQSRRVARRFERAQQIAGETEMELGPEGFTMRSQLGESRMRWAAVQAVFALAGGSALRIGATTIAMPDEALPEGMTPEDLRARIENWRAAA